MTVILYSSSLHGSQFATILLELEIPRVEHVIVGRTCWAHSRMDISPFLLLMLMILWPPHHTTIFSQSTKPFFSFFHVCYYIISCLLIVFMLLVLENKFLPMKLFLPMKFNFYVLAHFLSLMR